MSIKFGPDNETRFYILPYFELPPIEWTTLAVAEFGNRWYLLFVREASGVKTSGAIKLSDRTSSDTPAVIDEGLEGATSLWKGSLSWYAILSEHLTDEQLLQLAGSEIALLPKFQDTLFDLWDFRKADELIPGLVTGNPAVRYGEGYGDTGHDPLPYSASNVLIHNNGLPITNDGKLLLANYEA